VGVAGGDCEQIWLEFECGIWVNDGRVAWIYYHVPSENVSGDIDAVFVLGAVDVHRRSGKNSDGNDADEEENGAYHMLNLIF